jgi:hypothetical protein
MRKTLLVSVCAAALALSGIAGSTVALAQTSTDTKAAPADTGSTMSKKSTKKKTHKTKKSTKSEGGMDK